MTWTYSGDPSSSAKDAVRFAVGDTREAKPLLQDEEIYGLLKAAQDDPASAALAACRGIVFQLGRLRDETVGSVSISYSQQFEHYKSLLGLLQTQLGLFTGFSVYAGGTSLTDSYNIEHDPDRIPPDFARNRPPRVGYGLLGDSPNAPADKGYGEDRLDEG